MFGFKKSKDHDVRITDEQYKELTGKMSKKELKEFKRKQREAEADRDWDALILSELFRDD